MSNFLFTLTVQVGMLVAFLLGASVLTFIEFCDIFITWLLDLDCCNGATSKKQPRTESTNNITPENPPFKQDGAHVNNYDATAGGGSKYFQPTFYPNDSLQSRDYPSNSLNTLRENSLNRGRPLVTFSDIESARGSEV